MAKSYADPKRAFDYQNAEEGVIRLYLSLQNPLIVNAFNQIWRKFEVIIDGTEIAGTKNLIIFAKNKGYDGVIVENVRDYYNNNEQKTKGGNVYVAFEPNQIKLADCTNTTFDSNNADIRFAEGGSVGEPKKFTFMEKNPLQRGKALKSMNGLIRSNGVVIKLYEWVESFEKGLEIGISKMHSNKAEKGYVERPNIGDHLVHSKSEQEYYKYLEEGGYPYSKHLIDVEEQSIRQREKQKVEREEESVQQEFGKS